MEYNICAGGIVLNKNNQILLVTNDKKYWGFPKGRVEENETLIETAKREIYEETGLKKLKFVIKLEPYQRTQLNKDGSENKKIIKTIHMFVFKTEEANLKPVDINIGEVRWVDKNNVINMLHHEKDKRFFENIKNKI